MLRLLKYATMRKLVQILPIILLMSSLSLPIHTSAFPAKSEKFDFTLTNGNVVNLSDFQDKPIVLDWTASWCGLCEENLRVFRSLYDDFKDHANFITLGYARSGDDLALIRDIQNSKPNDWNFGFDHTNYADVVGTGNVDIWIMDTELNIVYSWDESIITKSDFSSKLKVVIGEVTSVFTSDDTVITSVVSFEEYDDELNTFGLLTNTLFLGFLILSSGLVLVTFILKKKN